MMTIMLHTDVQTRRCDLKAAGPGRSIPPVRRRHRGIYVARLCKRGLERNFEERGATLFGSTASQTLWGLCASKGCIVNFREPLPSVRRPIAVCYLSTVNTGGCCTGGKHLLCPTKIKPPFELRMVFIQELQGKHRPRSSTCSDVQSEQSRHGADTAKIIMKILFLCLSRTSQSEVEPQIG